MGNRSEGRKTTHLVVKVLGTDLNGNPFRQTAHAHNVSRRGARIEGIGCLRGPGETIEIEYRGNRAKFFVMWVGLPGTPESGHIGVKSLDHNRNIWKMELPAPGPDSYRTPNRQPEQVEQPSSFFTAAAHHSYPAAVPVNTGFAASEIFGKKAPESPRTGERRRYRRYAVSGGATFQTKGEDVRTSGKLTDISHSGCYVEAFFPFPAGTELDLILELRGVQLSAEGVVKVVYPGLGMGIEFTRIPEEYAPEFERLLSAR